MARAANYDDDFADDRGFESEGGSFAEQLDLQHYLRILRKHKWPITLFTAAITSLAAYYAFTATPVYSSTSTLLIEQQKANVVSIEELYGVDSENTDYYQTQFELLKSRSLAKRIIDRLGLWNNPELSPAARDAVAKMPAAQRDAIGDSENGVGGAIKGWLSTAGIGDESASDPAAGSSISLDVESSLAATDPNTGLATNPATDGLTAADLNTMTLSDSYNLGGSGLDDSAGFGTNAVQTPEERDKEIVLNTFMSRLTISPVRKTKLVKISYESTDPLLSARVANTVGEQYILSYLDAKMEMTTKASQWLTERLKTLKGTLDESEQRLIAFKQANDLVDVDGSVGRLNEQELLLLTTELATARSEFSSASDLYRDVQSLKGSPELLETIPAVQNDPLERGVKIEQGQAQRQLDELLNRYGDKHPRVVDAKSQLNTLNTTLQGHLSRVAGSVEKDYQLLRQRVATIQGKLASGKTAIQAIGTKKFELDALEREVGTNQELYDTFFSRMTEARSADGLETANARVTDFAVPSVRPVKPKKQLIIALAALASLVLSMLMAFLYEQMDDTIKSTNDVEHKLGMKLLGILPLVKGGMFKTAQSLPLNPAEIPDTKGTFSEAVNTVRTALCMDDGERTRKVIVVTSSVPGEGKSTAAINLAYSLAQLERVLLVDCDMRRPTVAKAAGFDKNVPGLSNLITNTAPARECIKRGVFDGSVDIVPSGPIPDQPLELLSSLRFEKILEQLGQHYDRIVIDSAPTQAVSDALVLSKLADAVVYAVKSHDTSIDLVKRGVQRLDQVKAPLAGILITQVDIDKITSYGGDYYYQGYYDYYGYTEKGGKEVRRPGKLRLSQEELIQIKTDESDVNLDLDYGMENDRLAMDRAPLRQAPARPAPAPRAAARAPAARAPAYEAADHEFDLTAQMDMPGPTERMRPEGRDQVTRLKKRFKDDLDII